MSGLQLPRLFVETDSTRLLGARLTAVFHRPMAVTAAMCVLNRAHHRRR